MLLAFAMTMLLGIAPAPRIVCSVGELRESPDYRYRVERIREFIDSATVIVRAVAVGPAEVAPSTTRQGSTSVISFAVQERLRGGVLSDTLLLPGVLVERDDFNPGPVPYTMVRPSGQRGSCFTLEYRAGAEYLLVLTNSSRGLTPHWKPLAPLNEQIRGSEDPWLHWVRQQVMNSAREPHAGLDLDYLCSGEHPTCSPRSGSASFEHRAR